jgi:hypothetical protein
VFKRNGRQKNPVSIIDAAAETIGGMASAGTPGVQSTEPVVPQTDEFTEVAQQTTSVIHQLQRELESRLSGKPIAAPRQNAPDVPPVQQSSPHLTRPGSNSQKGAVSPREASPDELERELQQLFEESPGADVTASDAEPVPEPVLDAIRDRVIEGVVDRILQEWQRPGNAGTSPLQREVTERLIQRVIQGIGTSKPSTMSPAASSAKGTRPPR